MSEIKNNILAHVKSEYGSSSGEELTFDTPLLSSGIIDSISALQLVDFLEKTFEIEFEAHEVDQENIDSINQMETFILSKKEK